MGLDKHVWGQLKNITADELMRALERDGWRLRKSKGSRRIFRKESRFVAIHFHSKKTFHSKLLKSLLDDIGWTEADLRRLKLIK